MNFKRIVCAFLMIISVAALFGCEEKAVQPSGENVVLSVKTTAVQAKGENYAELSYEVWVSFDKIEAGASAENRITLKDDIVTFRTSAFASDTPGAERLAAGKINVKRQAGQSIIFPIAVEWYPIGGSGSKYFRTFSDTMILDDDTVLFEDRGGETKETGTKPAETEPSDTEPTETKAPETVPPETKPAETDPPETKPTDDPITPGPGGDDPDAFTTWELRSDTGTYLNVVAKCSAADAPGGFRIRVRLYLEHSSIFVGSRTGGALKIAGQSVPYTTPTIERSEQDTVLTLLTSGEVTVKRGEVFSITANYPFNGVYGGVPISEILIEGKYVFE